MKKTVRFGGLRPAAPGGRNALRNPERGLRYEIAAGTMAGDAVQHGADASRWPFGSQPADGVTIGQGYCYLTQFWDSPISQKKLDAIEADFARIRALGHGEKFLLRFAYECERIGNGPTSERICEHMAQLKPVLDRNWDVIYVLQIGWVGLWGEFHGSVHHIERDIDQTAKIVQGTLDLLPPDRMTMMRRMNYKTNNLVRLFGEDREVTADTAFSQRPEAKIGFFNDGTLAGRNDGWSFPDPPHYSSPGEPDFDRVCRESPWIPVDGELYWSIQRLTDGGREDPSLPFHGIDLTYDSGLKAIERFRLHHYTTFSYVHGCPALEREVLTYVHGESLGVNTGRYGTIDAWKDTPVTAADLDGIGVPYSPAYFEGVPSRTAFEFIRDHLGYRLEAREATFDTEVRPGATFHVEVRLVNLGFATMINPREPVFVLVGPGGRAVEMPTGANAQSFQPHDPTDPSRTPLVHVVSAVKELPADLPAGEWTLALWLPDAAPSLRLRPDYAVRLANDIEWREEGGRGLNVLGAVRVSAAAAAV